MPNKKRIFVFFIILLVLSFLVGALPALVSEGIFHLNSTLVIILALLSPILSPFIELIYSNIANIVKKANYNRKRIVSILEENYRNFIQHLIIPSARGNTVNELLPLHSIERRIMSVEDLEKYVERGEKNVDSFPFTQIVEELKGSPPRSLSSSPLKYIITGILRKRKKIKNEGKRLLKYIITGIPGVGKTSCSFQLALKQLEAFNNKESNYLPLWFDIGERTGRKQLGNGLKSLRDILKDCSTQVSKEEQLKTYLAFLEGKSVDNVELRLSDDDFEIFWILDGWNENPINDMITWLSNRDTITIFSRMGGEPLGSSSISFDKYTLRPFTVQDSISFLTQFNHIPEKCARIIASSLDEHYGEEFLIPFFLNIIVYNLSMQGINDTVQTINYFNIEQTTKFSFLKDFFYSILERDFSSINAQRKLNDRLKRQILSWFSQILYFIVKKNSNAPSRMIFREEDLQDAIDNVRPPEIVRTDPLEVLTDLLFIEKVQDNRGERTISYSLVHELYLDFFLAYAISSFWEKKENEPKFDNDGRMYLQWMDNESFDEVWFLIADKWKDSKENNFEKFIIKCLEFRRDKKDNQDLTLQHILDYIRNRVLSYSFLHPNKRSISSHHNICLSLRLFPGGIKELDLSETKVTDISALVHCTNLQYLDLSGTKVTDISALVHCTNLQYLDLSGTDVQDISPLSHCPNLQKIYLSGTDVQDIRPLSSCPNLQVLYLLGTDVQDIRPLSSCPNLQVLYLLGTHVQDIRPLSHCPNLEELDLRGTHVQDIRPLSSCPNLQRLRLSGTKVTDISVLKNCPNLQELDLSDTDVQDISPLSSCLNLQELYLLATHVQDINPLSHCPKLQVLDLRGTHVQDINPLSHCPKLQVLDLHGTKVTDISVLKNCPNLQELDLSGTKVTDLNPLSSCLNLQELDLSGTKVTDLNPLSSCLNLQALYLSDTDVTDLNPLSSCLNLQALI